MAVPNRQAERQALKGLVGAFSNLAGEKRVADNGKGMFQNIEGKYFQAA